MIIPKKRFLSEEEIAEINSIVSEFSCKIQPIKGAHRNIYAIIGDERSETMINRLLGLDYVDRVPRMESVYRFMDLRSELAAHEVRVGNTVLKKAPFVIAGHCTIDPKNPSLFYETAHAVKEAGAHALRGGVWKPRTSPHSFQGTDDSLNILLQAKSETNLPVVTEVMDEAQLRIAIEAGVDVLQIGARNALNYPLLRKIGILTSGKDISVLLKRSLHMGSVNEFICAAEYIVSNGNPNVILCPRGTMPKLDGYRNHPDESITPLLKDKTWAPVVVDPSHSVGRAVYVPSCAMAAIAYGADGVVIETHINGRLGIGDDPLQSITPATLTKLIPDLNKIAGIKSHY